jgi:hypothetical protein
MKHAQNLLARITGRSTDGSPPDLFVQTLRTVVVLVGACVLFVGALSAAAVLITSKAVGSASPSSEAHESPAPAATPKKPLSI